MKQRFESFNMTQNTMELLNTINGVIENYKKQGYILTLRQLYYQLVSKAIIVNSDKEYKKLSDILVKGRMSGIVDWSAIEDRTRRPRLSYAVDDIADAIDDTIRQYKLDRLGNQKCYIEVWCEKDAISNILKRTTDKYHVRLMINKGYSSASAMYEASLRFKQNGRNKKKMLLYLGDHDPSGLDMIRDIGDRLSTFGVRLDTEDGYPQHLGITREQVEEFNPPPNPAKITDPRADWYIAEHGDTSWEVDALDPSTLNGLVEDAILEIIDTDKYNAMIKKEKSDKKKLEKLKDLADDIDTGDDDDSPTCDFCGEYVSEPDAIEEDDHHFCNEECHNNFVKDN